MTREQVAMKIRWSFVMWLVGIANVGAMLPQLVRIMQTKNTDGLAIEMFIIYFFIQVAFSLDGYFKKNMVLMVCVGLTAVVNAAVISMVLYLRHFAG